MDLGAVMQEVADRLATIPGLRTHGHPADNVQPPAAVVTYPEAITFDSTYARGMDQITLPVIVMVGRVSARSSRDVISAYAAGAGDRSIKQVAESGTYTAFDTVRVTDAEFDIVSVAGVEYLAATFSLDIAGTGAS
jgi:hypothetical protein